jgi:hypothetical protein
MRKAWILLTALAASATHADAGEDQFIFKTPSGNIACLFRMDEDSSVYCVRRDAPRSTPETPILNATIELGKGKATTGQFSGEVWYPDDAPVLAYGQSMTHAGVTCTSRTKGLTCANKAHGFRVNSKRIVVH